MSGDELVRAAGGVVVRETDRGRLALVVHRPKYDDWSFPKGKLDPGETEQECALREVKEETGLTCALLGELSPTHYRDRFGRPKRVRYWLMSCESDVFVPNDEVDRAVWADGREASRLLSYEHDAKLLREALG